MKINTLFHCLPRIRRACSASWRIASKRVVWGFIISLFTGLILGFNFNFNPNTILAQEAAPIISDDDVKEKIKERLEEVVDKGLEKVKGVMEEEKKSKLYAWVGTIESTSEKKISIETIDGLKEAKIASGAAIFELVTGKSKKNIDPEDIEKGQFIIAMGPKEEEIILAKRIIVYNEAPTYIKRETISCKVEEIDESEVTIRKNGETEVLTIGKKTELKINGIKKPTTEDIQINDHLTAIFTLDKNGKIDEIRIVLIVPGETNPQAEENEVKEESTTSAEEAEEKDQEESED